MEDCKEKGGPVDTDLEHCLSLNSGCGAFKNGYCDMDDTELMQEIEGSHELEKCQVSLKVQKLTKLLCIRQLIDFRKNVKLLLDVHFSM